MKTYLLGAAGVIFLSVIVSLLVPEGKLNKSINFIMRLICIAVLIQPVTGIFKLTDKDAAGTDGNYVDYEYVGGVYAEHQGVQLENLLKEKLGADTECFVTVDYADGEFKVTATEVKIKENNQKLIDKIYEYLEKLGYINITVYAEST